MINIINFKINSTETAIDVTVETDPSYIITSAIVWTDETYKNYDLAVDVSSLLSQESNLESFSIPASMLGLERLGGIYFIEFISNSNEDPGCNSCNNTIGVAASLNCFKECLLSKVLNYSICNNFSSCGENILCNIINIELLIQSLTTSLEFGYYNESLIILKALRKLCKCSEGCSECNECSECKDLPTPDFRTGLNYGTLNGTLILI